MRLRFISMIFIFSGFKLCRKLIKKIVFLRIWYWNILRLWVMVILRVRVKGFGISLRVSVRVRVKWCSNEKLLWIISILIICIIILNSSTFFVHPRIGLMDLWPQNLINYHKFAAWFWSGWGLGLELKKIR